jgi:hypothetical protein
MPMPAAARALDGDLAAEILKRFENAATPIEVAIETKVLLPRVLELHADWRRAREECSPGPSIKDLVTQLESRLATLEIDRVDPIASLLREIDQRLVTLKTRLDLIPAPAHRADLTCSCGATGYYGLPYECTCCGRPIAVLGFQPQRP